MPQAQRRAGALSAGADVRERSAAKWRNDGDGAGWRSAVSCEPLHRTRRRPPDRSPPDRSDVHGAQGGSRARDRSERSGELARDVPLGAWVFQRGDDAVFAGSNSRLRVHFGFSAYVKLTFRPTSLFPPITTSLEMTPYIARRTFPCSSSSVRTRKR